MFYYSYLEQNKKNLCKILEKLILTAFPVLLDYQYAKDFRNIATLKTRIFTGVLLQGVKQKYGKVRKNRDQGKL